MSNSNNKTEAMGEFDTIEDQALAGVSGGSRARAAWNGVVRWWRGGGRRAVGNGVVQGGVSVGTEEAINAGRGR